VAVYTIDILPIELAQIAWEQDQQREILPSEDEGNQRRDSSQSAETSS
jgi:hypothetical protein